jgi:hypothetical protein
MLVAELAGRHQGAIGGGCGCATLIVAMKGCELGAEAIEEGLRPR